MPSYLGTRRRGGKTIHRYMVRRQGHPVKVFQDYTKTEAKRLAAGHEAKIDAGKVGPGEADIDYAIRLYLESEEYEALKEQDRQKARLEWMRMLPVPWGGRVGQVRLAEPERVHRAVSAVKDALARGQGPGRRNQKPGAPASRATRNRYVSTLGVVFDSAARHDPACAMPYNPARVLRIKSERNRERTWYRDAEILSLYEACKASGDDRLSVLVLAALSSGARQAELMQIRHQGLDLARGSASIVGKGNRKRVIRVYGWALDELRVFVRERPASIGGFVFANAWGDPIFPRKPWNDALVAAGIKGGPAEERGRVDFHSLRHTSLMLAAAVRGATEYQMMMHSGHTSTKGLNTYLHPGEEVRSKLAACLLPDWRTGEDAQGLTEIMQSR